MTERNRDRWWNSEASRWEYPISDEQLARIKQAFFATFVARGELWFPYGDDVGIDDKLGPVDSVWDDFINHILEQE